MTVSALLMTERTLALAERHVRDGERRVAYLAGIIEDVLQLPLPHSSLSICSAECASC